MQTSKYQATAGPIIKKYLRSSSPRGRSGQSCNPQPDCCGKYPRQPKRNSEEPFIERDCFPDFYSLWKPKLPKLISNQCGTKREATCFTKKTCTADMKGAPSLAEKKQQAKQCQMANSPGVIQDKAKRPEVIIVSKWCPLHNSKHIFLTDFAYNILCSKRPRSRRKICHRSNFHQHRHLRTK